MDVCVVLEEHGEHCGRKMVPRHRVKNKTKQQQQKLMPYHLVQREGKIRWPWVWPWWGELVLCGLAQAWDGPWLNLSRGRPSRHTRNGIKCVSETESRGVRPPQKAPSPEGNCKPGEPFPASGTGRGAAAGDRTVGRGETTI